MANRYLTRSFDDLSLQGEDPSGLQDNTYESSDERKTVNGPKNSEDTDVKKSQKGLSDKPALSSDPFPQVDSFTTQAPGELMSAPLHLQPSSSYKCRKRTTLLKTQNNRSSSVSYTAVPLPSSSDKTSLKTPPQATSLMNKEPVCFNTEDEDEIEKQRKAKEEDEIVYGLYNAHTMVTGDSIETFWMLMNTYARVE